MSDAALIVNLPEDVASELERLAHEEGMTPEQMLARIATQRVGALKSAKDFFAERATRADWSAFDRVFGAGRQGGEAPRPGDEVE